MPGPDLSAGVLRGIVASTVKPLLGPAVPPRAQRLCVDNLSRYALPGARVQRRRETIGGVPVLVQTPAQARPGARIVYFHGGGYVIGSASAHAALTSRLAVAACATVLSADYRLAPENPFPAAVEDGLALYAAVLEDGQDPGRLAIAGDSAGGGLALSTVLAARDAGLTLPARMFLISPWLDLRLTELPAGDQEASDPLLSRAGLDRWADDYCATHTRADPRISPGLAHDLSGLPPTLIQYDTDEILAGDAVRFAARVRSGGGQVELQPFQGLWHDFQLFTVLPQARAALTRAGGFLAAD